MTPPTAWASKGDAVEEWIDRVFFRPIGYRVAQWLEPTRISADSVTMVCLAIGLIAGHLFFYANWRVNALGLGLFLLSDVFDSADGQLARLRGASTAFGRMLDGLSDNARFVNLYLHLIARLMLGGHGMEGLLLGIAAGISHSFQASVADYIRQAYLFFTGAGGELDLPEDVTGRRGLTGLLYGGYVRRQAKLLGATAALARMVRTRPDPGLASRWREQQLGVVRQCAWIAQNIRFALLGVTAVVRWPIGFFWLTIALNVVLFAILAQHERVARQLAGEFVLPPSQARYA